MTRISGVLTALHAFFDGFLDSYAEGCAPDGAELPYLTYALTVPDEWETGPYYARVWYRARSYVDIAAKLDAIDAAIGAGVCLPMEGGAVWLYKGDRFVQFLPDRTDPDVKCAYLSLGIAVNINDR